MTACARSSDTDIPLSWDWWSEIGAATSMAAPIRAAPTKLIFSWRSPKHVARLSDGSKAEGRHLHPPDLEVEATTYVFEHPRGFFFVAARPQLSPQRGDMGRWVIRLPPAERNVCLGCGLSIKYASVSAWRSHWTDAKFFLGGLRISFSLIHFMAEAGVSPRRPIWQSGIVGEECISVPIITASRA